MCGIAGVISSREDFLNTGKSLGRLILPTMKRRGPDDDGMYLTDGAALFHARLAVVDIEGGRQPMVLRQGEREFALVYNGELYNTDEVRQELISAGYDFSGHSDTEVVLKAYAHWGQDCVNKFNGIFAFAVWEKHRRRLFAARDRMGVKPFYYAVKNGKFIFASEIKSILAHPDMDAEVDIGGISEIMLIGPGKTPGCGVFRGICELPPACCGYFEDGKFSYFRYWQLHDRRHDMSLEDTIDRVRYLVTDSIERQLVSDVPIATFLSGGLDSSLISSVACAELKKRGLRLKTFSVYYRDNAKYFQASKFQPNSDEEYIEVMRKYLDADHNSVVIDTPELTDALFDAVDARDLPGMADVDSSMLLLCKKIKEQATVALSGECADEIFGGYPWYRDREIRMAEGFPWAQSTDYRAGFIRDELLPPEGAREYVDERYRATLNDTARCPGLSPDEFRLREMVRLNMDWFMQTLLSRKDLMSMYSGLEVRVPFCDYRIAEFMYSIPWEMKDLNGYEKGLLRKASEGLLPHEVLWRKKSPYPKTHNPAYLAEVSRRLQDVIDDPRSPLLKVAKKEKLQELLTASRQTPWYGQLMTTPQTIAYFLQINYWMEKYNIRLV
jgi:asparagine synthase (glutamine-hydrolysing)